MSGHRIAMVVVHTIAGLFLLVCIATIWIVAAALSPTFDGSFGPGLVALCGKPIAIVLMTLASIEVVAALSLLRSDRRWPRHALGAISALPLFVFPIGTAIAVYAVVFLGSLDGPSSVAIAP